MKGFLFNLLLCVFSLAISLEVAGYFFDLKYEGIYFFDHAAATLDEWNNPKGENLFNHFKEANLSCETGWAPHPNGHYTQPNAIGENPGYTLDATAARSYAGYSTDAANVILIGDSYTFGMEADDEQTIAARIYKHSGIVSANIGYAGFDPLQSFLRAKSERKNYPHAKVIVMGIMYEDIDRLVNSYRMLFNAPKKINEMFSLKPYMLAGDIYMMKPESCTSFKGFMEAAHAAAKNDYWAVPPHRFPYSLALIESLGSHRVRNRLGEILMSKFDREFERQYRDTELGYDLFKLVENYAQWAEKEGLTPMVVFIPKNSHDIRSPMDWVEKYRAQLPANLIVKNIDFTKIDGEKYNLKPTAHPSPYGYDALAQQYAEFLKEVLTP